MIRKAIEIELHPYHMNREEGFRLSRAWTRLIHTLRGHMKHQVQHHQSLLSHWTHLFFPEISAPARSFPSYWSHATSRLLSAPNFASSYLVLPPSLTTDVHATAPGVALISAKLSILSLCLFPKLHFPTSLLRHPRPPLLAPWCSHDTDLSHRFSQLCFVRLAPLYLHCFPCKASLIALIMEAVQTSKTLVNSHQSTWCYNPEDSHLHNHWHENPKSYLDCNLLHNFLHFTALKCRFNLAVRLNGGI
jgi:hypothetical protein